MRSTAAGASKRQRWLRTERSTAWFAKQPRTVTARHVVFSASALGTMDLLMRMKARGALPAISDRLGDDVRTNSESILGVRFPGKRFDMSQGIAIGSGMHIDQFTHIEATRYSGIDTKRALTLIYTLSGLMAAVAGIIMAARFNSVRVGHGEAYLLITVLACFLGGVDPFGGFGRVASVAVALVILQCLSSGLNLLGANQHLATAVWGLVLLGVMILRFLSHRWLAARPGGGRR